MSDTFRIAINQGPIFGILSYNVNTKEVIIDFPKEDIKKQAELYSTKPTSSESLWILENLLT